eukprot:8113616-Alexandrium_andersonii.AAC.1
MAEEAAKLVGRSRPSLVCPFLAKFRTDMRVAHQSLRASWDAVRRASSPAEARHLRSAHRDLRREVRAQERRWKT